MEQQNKRKRKFALIIVSEKEDGTIRQRVIGYALVQMILFLILAIMVAISYGYAYHAYALKDARAEIVTCMEEIANLTDENEALSVENATLTSKVTVLSETVSKKVAAEDELSFETIENALPKGFPLSGSASMEETSGDDGPMLKFSAQEGTNVITTGTGTVISVDADDTYKTKIVIDHGNGYQSVYKNNGTPLVKLDEQLGKGYILFTVGEDNQELAYQVIHDEEYIDPMLIIEING